jgi:hypothetical protein
MAQKGANAASRITMEEFTEVTLGGVLRAIEARKLPLGPIIYGIIWTPDLGSRVSPAAQRARRRATR